MDLYDRRLAQPTPPLSECAVGGPPKSLMFCQCPAWNSERQCLQKDLNLLNTLLKEDNLYGARFMLQRMSEDLDAIRKML